MSDDPTNSVKALKEDNNQYKNTVNTYKKHLENPTVYTNTMG